jgi:hypothetical protein
MSVKFTFGGIKRELRIELGVAPRLEEATGLGFLALVKALTEKTATLSQVVEVIRIAFDANGAKYSSDEILAQIQEDANGVINAYAVAGILVMELCLRPPGAKPGKKGAAAPAKNASH